MEMTIIGEWAKPFFSLFGFRENRVEAAVAGNDKVTGLLAASYRGEVKMADRLKSRSELMAELESLRHSEMLLRSLVETTTDIFAIVDSRGIIQYTNPAVGQVMGYTGTELVGSSGWDLVDPDDLERTKAFFYAVDFPKDSFTPSIEIRVQFKDGARHWMEVNARAVVDPAGRRVVAVNLRDISAGKRVEQTLQQRVEELAALQATVLDLSVQQDLLSLLNTIVERIMTLLNAPCGFIYLYDARANDLELAVEVGFDVPKGTRLRMGEGMAGRVAVSRQPLIVDDYTQWQERSQVYAGSPYRAVVEAPMLSGGQLIGVMGATETVHTTRTYSEADARILSIFAGQAANAVYNARLFQGLQQELAERVKAQELLRESEARFRGIYENSTVGMYRSTPDGRILLSNQALMKMLGFESFEPHLRRNLELEGIEAGYDRGKFIERIESAGELHGLESTWTRRDGSVIFIQESARAIRDPSGTVLYYEGTVVDITERKLAEDEVRRLNDELELRVQDRTAQLQAANKELESFSYSVSHDLRAPLRAIDGFSHIIQEDYADSLPSGVNRLLNSIRANTRQMSRLIDDLLKFSRMGRQPLNKQIVEPLKLVQQALEILSQEQQDRQVEIEITDLALCQGDPGLLLQVWINLISNAIKYTRPRETALIQIGSQPDENGKTIYSIRDNGVGFDMEYAGKLFGVFQRLHNVDEFEGSGVGLALVQQIIMRHGGRIWADSKPGQGASFHFTL
jgi:PAS domain S-box-containing protein